jgi:hypothetical protein
VRSSRLVWWLARCLAYSCSVYWWPGRAAILSAISAERLAATGPSTNVMLSEDEIIRAHDLLAACVAGEVPCQITSDVERLILLAGIDALCWVLQCEHNRQFGRNLDMIRAKLLGYAHDRA